MNLTKKTRCLTVAKLTSRIHWKGNEFCERKNQKFVFNFAKFGSFLEINYKNPQIENDQKKESGSINEKKEEETPKNFPEAAKKSDIEPPDDSRYEILTTLEGASFQSRLPFDKMTT